MRQSKKSTTKHVMTAIMNERKDGGCLEKYSVAPPCPILSYKKHVMVGVIKELKTFHHHVSRKLKDLQQQPLVNQFLAPIIYPSYAVMHHHLSRRYHVRQYLKKVQEAFAQVQILPH
jgi:hypothetical protein